MTIQAQVSVQAQVSRFRPCDYSMWISIASRRLFAIRKNCCAGFRPMVGPQLLNYVRKHFPLIRFTMITLPAPGARHRRGLIEAADE